MTDILTSLRADAGHLTLATLIQERTLAAIEIERLRARVDELLRRREPVARTSEKRMTARDSPNARRVRDVPAREDAPADRSSRSSPAPTALLRLKDVSRLFGIARSTIYNRIAEGTFPAPLRISERSVRWRLEELEEWVRGLPYSR